MFIWWETLSRLCLVIVVSSGYVFLYTLSLQLIHDFAMCVYTVCATSRSGTAES